MTTLNTTLRNVPKVYRNGRIYGTLDAGGQVTTPPIGQGEAPASGVYLAGDGIDISANVISLDDDYIEVTSGAGVKLKYNGTLKLDVQSSSVNIDTALDVSLAAIFRDDISSESFSSGFAGSGFKLEDDSGDYHLTVDELTVRGGMRIYSIEIQRIKSGSGSYWFTDGGKVDSVTTPLYRDHELHFDTDSYNLNVGFALRDIIRCQQWTGRNVKYYTADVKTVNTTSGAVTSIEVDIIDGTDTPEAGDEIVRIGNATNSDRQGSVYITSTDSDAPYIDILDGVTDESFSGHIKARLGKLDGITDADFGGALSGYGLYSENVYLKGEIVASGGEIAGWTIDSDALYVGTKKTSDGYSSDGITIDSDGSIHAENFYINSDGSIAARNIALETDEQGSGGTQGYLTFDKNQIYVDHSDGANNATFMINYDGGSPSATYRDRDFIIYDGYGNGMIELFPSGNGGVTLATLNLEPKFINMANLPTSSAGLPSGGLYASGGYVRIA